MSSQIPASSLIPPAETPDELVEDFLQAEAGRLIVRNLKRIHSLDDQVCWIILPSGNLLLNEIVTGNSLSRYLEERCYKRALVLRVNTQGANSPATRRSGECEIVFQNMSEEDIACVVKYYRLVQYAPDIIVASLEEPYCSPAWIGHFGISLRQLVDDCLLRGKPVPWMAWNVDEEAIEAAIYHDIGKLHGKRIYLFGLTQYAAKISNALQKAGVPAHGLVDSDPGKWGQSTRIGPVCQSPQEALAPHDPGKSIVIVSKYARSMRRTLASLGYADEQIVEIPITGDIASSQDDGPQTLLREFAKACHGYRIRQRFGKEKLITCIGGIGDVYWMCRLLPAYLARCNVEACTLLLEDRVSDAAINHVTSSFGIGAEAFTCKTDDFVALYKAWDFLGGDRLNMKPSLHLGSRLFKSIQPAKRHGHFPPWRNHLNCMWLQYFTYPGPLELAEPSLRPADEAAYRSLGFPPRRTVVFSPYASAYRPLLLSSPGFWEQLASKLAQRGYTVCTNCAGEEQPVEGTISYCPPYDELVSFLNYAGGLVAQRSGLCDVASTASDCKMVLLYDRGVGVIPDTFSLRRMGIRNQAHDLVYDGNPESLLACILEEFPPLGDCSEGEPCRD